MAFLDFTICSKRSGISQWKGNQPYQRPGVDHGAKHYPGDDQRCATGYAKGPFHFFAASAIRCSDSSCA